MREAAVNGMVRKQIQISERQKALLERLSRQRGISQAEVVRRAIEREAAGCELPAASPAAAAWEQAREFMLGLRDREPGAGEGYRWNREELYTR